MFENFGAMAIYQFWLNAIPRQGLIKKYGQMPEKLEVSQQDDSFEEFVESCWTSVEYTSAEVCHQIDKLLSRQSCGEADDSVGWKVENSEVDHDAELVFNPATGKITYIAFRADLTEPDLKFLREMVKMASVYDWALVNFEGNVVNPIIEEVFFLVQISNSFRFLNNPTQFFEDLQSGKISI